MKDPSSVISTLVLMIQDSGFATHGSYLVSQGEKITKSLHSMRMQILMESLFPTQACYTDSLWVTRQPGEEGVHYSEHGMLAVGPNNLDHMK